MDTQGIYGALIATKSPSGVQASILERAPPGFRAQFNSKFPPAQLSMPYGRNGGLCHTWSSGAVGSRRGFAASAAAATPTPPTPSGSPSGGEPGIAGTVTEGAQKTVNSLVDMVGGAWEAAKDEAVHGFPRVHNLMDPSGGNIAELAIPAGIAIGASFVAWLVLPRVLRKFHQYVEAGPTSRLLGRMPQEKQPYELSVFGALEDPARLLGSLMTFSYLGFIVAPTSIGAHYLTQIWSGGTVLSVIWFLYRWKSNVFARIVTGKAIAGADRERYLTMDRLSSIGLLLLGGMAFAEACGVAVQSILTVGGIGGVATAFAARDILGNMLSGVALQFSRPFSLGDSISAGNVSGQVIEMGLHSTQLLNSDKYPIVVPNSYFSNQVIVNKSRVRWRGFSMNLPIQIQDLDKIPVVTSDIREMLMSYPKIFLENEKPRCHVSQVGPSSLNIAITCNLRPMGTDEYLLTGEELLMEAARIVTKRGATLGGAA